MPTYQYACTECGHQLEAVQSFTDDSLTVCPACEGRLRKQFGSVGIVFKGPGFYRTDSRNGANGSGKAESRNGEGESKSDSKADSKAAGSSGNGSSEKSREKKSSDKTSSTAAATAS